MSCSPLGLSVRLRRPLLTPLPLRQYGWNYLHFYGTIVYIRLQNYGIFYLLNIWYIELNNKHFLSQTYRSIDDYFIYKLNACTLKHTSHWRYHRHKCTSLLNEETFDIFLNCILLISIWVFIKKSSKRDGNKNLRQNSTIQLSLKQDHSMISFTNCRNNDSFTTLQFYGWCLKKGIGHITPSCLGNGNYFVSDNQWIYLPLDCFL